MEHDRQWLETFLQYFYRSAMIPVMICTENDTKLQLTYAPTVLAEEPAVISMAPLLRDPITEPVFLVRNDFYFGAVPASSFDCNILIGPLSQQRVNISVCQNLLNTIGISSVKAADLRYRIDKTPLISRPRLLSILRFLDFSINASSGTPHELMLQPVDVSDNIFQLRHEHYSPVHNTGEPEQHLLSLVEQGKNEELAEFLPTLMNGDYSSGLDFEDIFVRRRTIFITGAALCSRAAIRGGMDYEQAVTLSDEYLRQMMSMKKPDDIWPFLGLMMVEFAERVHRLKTPDSASLVTKTTIQWIHAHLFEPFTIEEMAENLGYSSSYLSHTFRKDMDKDIKTYILETKIEESKRLLRQKKTIPEITDALAFSSPSHFQKVFKKITGMTPREWLKSQ